MLAIVKPRYPLPGKTAEGALPSDTEAINKKVGIEGEGIMDSQALHLREGNTVHETEGLVRKILGDTPGGFKIDGLRTKNRYPRLPERLPKTQRSLSAKVRSKQGAGLACDQLIGKEAAPFGILGVEFTRLPVMTIGDIGYGIPSSRINENAQGGGPHRDIGRAFQKRPSDHSTPLPQ